MKHLGVVDVELGAVADEALAHVDGRRLPRVARVLHAKHGDAQQHIDGCAQGAHARAGVPPNASRTAHYALTLHVTSLLQNQQCGDPAKRSTFLKAKPRTAMCLPEMVLNMALMTISTNRCFW